MKDRLSYSLVSALFACLIINACTETGDGSSGQTEDPFCISGDTGDCDDDGYPPGEGKMDDCDDYNPAARPDRHESCDGIDNDCNGVIDDVVEIYGSHTVHRGDICGVSNTAPCTRGIMDCVADKFVCTAVEPVFDTCDGIDNDCDGTIDNLTTERCDGIDNDCNGVIDDVIDGAGHHAHDTCYDATLKGICAFGFWTCDMNATLLTCLKNEPVTEICNGLDDDCNGVIDDVVENGVQAGAPCVVPGAKGACKESVWTCDINPPKLTCPQIIQPKPGENCDGIDENCNGIIDDPDILGGLQGTYLGCPATGGCDNGKMINVCSNGAYECQAKQNCCTQDENGWTCEILACIQNCP